MMGKQSLPDDTEWLAARLIGRPRWHAPVAGRVCGLHPERRAQDRCDRCGQPFCSVCLHSVGRGRICAACLTWLGRERAGPPLRERLRPLLPAQAATVIVRALLAGGVAAINRGLAGWTTSGNLVGTTDQVACLQKYPAPHKRYVVGGRPLYGYPPAQLPDELPCPAPRGGARDGQRLRL